MLTVAFKIYDIDRDGYISNGELYQVLKIMVGNNLKESQLQQIVDKTIIYSDKDGDGKISYEEFCAVCLNNIFSVFMSWQLYEKKPKINIDIRLQLLQQWCRQPKKVGGPNHFSLLVSSKSYSIHTLDTPYI